MNNYILPAAHTMLFAALLLLVALIPLNPVGAQSRGLISKAKCPNSCRSRGIPKNQCRDWREGDLCVVEDLRRRPEPLVPPVNIPRPEEPEQPRVPTGGVERCQDYSRKDIARPHVFINRVKRTGGMFSRPKYRVRGTIEGICLLEAGLFERGKVEEKIVVSTSPSFQRVEFEVVADPDRDPEIRAYNVHGEVARVSIEPDYYDSNGYPRQRDDHPGYRDRTTGNNSNNRQGSPANLLDEIFGGN